MGRDRFGHEHPLRYQNGFRWCGQCGEKGPKYAKSCPNCGKPLRVHPPDKSKMELKRIG